MSEESTLAARDEREDDATTKRRREVSARLRTIEGQIRAVRRMVDDGEGCLSIATQATAALEGLRSALRVVLRNYMEDCLDVNADAVQREEAYDRFIGVVERFIR